MKQMIGLEIPRDRLELLELIVREFSTEIIRSGSSKPQDQMNLSDASQLHSYISLRLAETMPVKRFKGPKDYHAAVEAGEIEEVDEDI